MFENTPAQQKKFLFVLLAIIIFGGIVFLFVQKERKAMNINAIAPSVNVNVQERADLHVVSQPEPVTSRSALPVADAPVAEVFTQFSPQDIHKGGVTWQSPEDIGDLRWTDKDVYNGTYDEPDKGTSLGVKYVKVGTVVNGKYSGSEVIVAAFRIFGDGPYASGVPSLSYYLRNGAAVVWLLNADIANGEAKETLVLAEIEKQAKEFPKLNFHIPHQTIDNETRIEELSLYPAKFTGRNERELFVKNAYPGAAFFSATGLKSVFIEPNLGELWMTDNTLKQESSLELNSYMARETVAGKSGYKTVLKKKIYDPVTTGGFFFKRPDGITVSYKLQFDIFDKFDREGVLQAVWNDGTRNKDTFEEYPGGCGSSSYAYDVSGQVKIEQDALPKIPLW